MDKCATKQLAADRMQATQNVVHFGFKAGTPVKMSLVLDGLAWVIEARNAWRNIRTKCAAGTDSGKIGRQPCNQGKTVVVGGNHARQICEHRFRRAMPMVDH